MAILDPWLNFDNDLNGPIFRPLVCWRAYTICTIHTHRHNIIYISYFIESVFFFVTVKGYSCLLWAYQPVLMKSIRIGKANMKIPLWMKTLNWKWISSFRTKFDTKLIVDAQKHMWNYQTSYCRYMYRLIQDSRDSIIVSLCLWEYGFGLSEYFRFVDYKLNYLLYIKYFQLT